MLTLTLAGEEQTRKVAARLADFMQPGSVILLEGPLGAGKTTFVRGLAQGLGLSTEYDIVSPTFTLLNIYPARLPLYHADCYRTSADDMFETDLREQARDGVLAIEWPHANDMCVSDNCWHVSLQYDGLQHRTIKLSTPQPLREKIEPLIQQSL